MLFPGRDEILIVSRLSPAEARESKQIIQTQTIVVDKARITPVADSDVAECSTCKSANPLLYTVAWRSSVAGSASESTAKKTRQPKTRLLRGSPICSLCWQRSIQAKLLDWCSADVHVCTPMAVLLCESVPRLTEI